MKKFLSIIIAVTLIAASFLGLPSTALAAGEALDVSTQTTELLEGGSVEFAATITAGSEVLVNYFISYNGTKVYPNDDAPIAANTSRNVAFKMDVTDAMLGTPLQFVLGTEANASLATDSVTINKKVLSIKLAASAKASQTLAGEGSTITFTFAIENQGEAKIDNILVTAAELNGGKALRDAFSLDSTQSYSVVYKYTMGSDVTIHPIVNYSSGGVAQDPLVLNPIELTQTERKVVPTLTVDNKNPKAGEDVTFTLNILNEGNVPYTDLTVLMNGEEVDFPANNLKPGDDYSEDYTMSFLVSTDVVFKVSLKDHTGNTVSVNSNTISIELPVDSDVLQEKLEFNMNVDRPALTGEATINFSGNITNSSEYILSNISVDEATLGNVYSADELAATSSKKLEFPVNINETTTYNFVLTVTDRNGKEYTVNAEPITVTLSSVAAEEDTTEEVVDDAVDVDNSEELTLDSNKGGLGSLGALGIISIVLIVLIIGVGIALIVLWRKGASAPSKGPGRPAAPKNRTVKKPAKKYKDRNNF